MTAFNMGLEFVSNVKPCKCCGQTKDLSAYPKVPKARDGRGGRCYTCAYAARAVLVTDEKRAAAASRTRLWKERNPDKVKARREVDRRLSGRITIEQLHARSHERRAERHTAKSVARMDAAVFADVRRILREQRDARHKAVSAMDRAVSADIRRYLPLRLVSVGGAYVYLITVDHLIRYVGKGTGTRAWDHVSNAIKALRYVELGMIMRPNEMYSKLCDSIRNRSNVCVHIVRDGMSDCDAYNLEWKLIGVLRPIGILWNSSNGTRR